MRARGLCGDERINWLMGGELVGGHDSLSLSSGYRGPHTGKWLAVVACHMTMGLASGDLGFTPSG
ncbi:predicted protein [Plenodomus lingam JN3]|uniref:Predicted protein n=1 Tax=Leptosphaeria maculans (strain JN3 / isolate v23.1.3 / race Av1-4-5-6-7-8) TaxID=985895 RepID=E5A116_LEPMJ|nr:predicted protein [Plenodomus lingam JN3]CBX97312.1 predicted protein [Plenodomus lingam JN3]